MKKDFEDEFEKQGQNLAKLIQQIKRLKNEVSELKEECGKSATGRFCVYLVKNLT